MLLSTKRTLFIPTVFLFVGGLTHSKFTPLEIIGGKTVNIQDFPYQVSVQYFDEHNCGGAIINENYIITAAHCTNRKTIYSVNVRVGTSVRDADGTVLNLKTIYQHPQFNEQYDFDISLLELEKPLVFGDKVKPVGLPDSINQIQPGDKANITGWGTTEPHGNVFSRDLKRAEISIVSRDDCLSAYGQEITENMFCAGSTDGSKDACHGDSGGPLVINNAIYGVISWGRGCGKADYPGVYTSITAVKPFIDKIIYSKWCGRKKEEF